MYIVLSRLDFMPYGMPRLYLRKNKDGFMPMTAVPRRTNVIDVEMNMQRDDTFAPTRPLKTIGRWQRIFTSLALVRLDT